MQQQQKPYRSTMMDFSREDLHEFLPHLEHDSLNIYRLDRTETLCTEFMVSVYLPGFGRIKQKRFLCCVISQLGNRSTDFILGSTILSVPFFTSVKIKESGITELKNLLVITVNATELLRYAYIS